MCIKKGSRKKFPRKKNPPNSKPNPIPNLTLTLPPDPPRGAFFRGYFFLTPLRVLGKNPSVVNKNSYFY